MLPERIPGQVVVMDNASIHKSAKARELIEGAGCSLLCLPPYSPDVNPIEKLWAYVKRIIANTAHAFSSLFEALFIGAEG